MSDETTNDQTDDDHQPPLSTSENRRWGLVFVAVVVAVLVYCFILSPLFGV